MKHAFVLVALVSLSTIALSAEPGKTAYRCGNSYSQVPCPGGKAIDTADARSKDQKAQADATNTRTQRMADAMEKSRRQREAEQRKAALKEIDKSAAKTVAKDPKAVPPVANPKKKPKNPEHFTAKAPADQKKNKAGTNKQANADGSTNPGNASR